MNLMKNFIAESVPDFLNLLQRYNRDNQYGNDNDVYSLGITALECLSGKRDTTILEKENGFSEYQRVYQSQPDSRLIELIQKAIGRDIKTMGEFGGLVRQSQTRVGIRQNQEPLSQWASKHTKFGREL